MGAPNAFGYIVFFLAPFVLWFVVDRAAASSGDRQPLLAIIAGGDGRLSVSRLQALLWTFVVFGAYCAAMAVSSQVTTQSWIQIPETLLALTGISIASGVLSSLIARAIDDSKSMEIQDLKYSDDKQLIYIIGKDFGNKRGTVKFGGNSVPVKVWDDKQLTLLAAAAGNKAKVLVVDTANGKAGHRLTLKDSGYELSEATTAYELIDLFRNDQSARGLDLMKFQMFGWTIIAIAIYVIYFLTRLNSSISALPAVDSSVVVLTGISQAGYLAGKGVATTRAAGEPDQVRP